MASQDIEEELLKGWFSSSTPLAERKPYPEKGIREISTSLERLNKEPWSRITRIYIILRLIGQLPAIDVFLAEGITDTFFPFTQRSLPQQFAAQSARTQFIEYQHLVYNSKTLDLEKEGGRHCHFPDPNEIPLKKVGPLGKGGSGFVDRVISTITHRQYALKLMSRGKTFKKDKRILHDFEKELLNLKRLSRAHRHIVELIGSYTDPKYVGILMHPVADRNLAQFLEIEHSDDQRILLRSFFGCLTSALGFLHDNKIRHKDVKPTNILVKGEELFLTDFGVSVDWTEAGHSTTLGPTALTPRYCAPEVAACLPRNSTSDIWSLGCVFFEIWAVLKGFTINQLSEALTVDGLVMPYHSKEFDTASWMTRITLLPGPQEDDMPAVWIKNLLDRDREQRWSSHVLMEHIREHSLDPATHYLYIGRCCLEDEETAESVISYSDEPTASETVNPGTHNKSNADPAADYLTQSEAVKAPFTLKMSAQTQAERTTSSPDMRQSPSTSVAVSSILNQSEVDVEEEKLGQGQLALRRVRATSSASTLPKHSSKTHEKAKPSVMPSQQQMEKIPATTKKPKDQDKGFKWTHYPETSPSPPPPENDNIADEGDGSATEGGSARRDASRKERRAARRSHNARSRSESNDERKLRGLSGERATLRELLDQYDAADKGQLLEGFPPDYMIRPTMWPGAAKRSPNSIRAGEGRSQSFRRTPGSWSPSLSQDDSDSIKDTKRTNNRFTSAKGAADQQFTGSHPDLWTEIVKELVAPAVMSSSGYIYEETDSHWYVRTYLSYTDVLDLVERSDRLKEWRESDYGHITSEGQTTATSTPPIERSSGGSYLSSYRTRNNENNEYNMNSRNSNRLATRYPREPGYERGRDNSKNSFGHDDWNRAFADSSFSSNPRRNTNNARPRRSSSASAPRLYHESLEPLAPDSYDPEDKYTKYLHLDNNPSPVWNDTTYRLADGSFRSHDPYDPLPLPIQSESEFSRREYLPIQEPATRGFDRLPSRPASAMPSLTPSTDPPKHRPRRRW